MVHGNHRIIGNMKKTLFALVVLLSFLAVSTKSYAYEKKVNIPAPGKLKSLIDKKEYGSITSIVITGEINDKDMKVIEELVNLETLDMFDAKQAFYYFPTFPKLKTLYLPKECRNNYKTVKGYDIHISDCILCSDSLQTICMTSHIANKLGAMPNLRKVGLYDVRVWGSTGKGNTIPIDTLVLWDEDDKVYANRTYCGYQPKIILNRHTNNTILNAYEPERTDYKGINILPDLHDYPNHQINTLEVLDLSDVVFIPNGYFRNCTMKEVVFSEQLRFVGHDAFENCKNLKEVTLPGKNTTLKLDNWVFNGCSNLKYVHFLGSVNVRGTAYGNHCVVEFDKPSNIEFESAKSPFSHFVFNAVPEKLKIGSYNTKAKEILSYIEVPANTQSSFTQFIGERYILEKGKKAKSYTLNLEKPGTILSNLPLDDLDIIDSLTIVGFLYDTDMKIFDKCKRLSYLDLGRAVITYSPETLREERQKMEAFKAIFAMAGAVADAKYDNFEMSALDHAYVKAFEQLAKGASTVSAADNNCIVPNESFANLVLLKKVILPYRAKHIGKDVLSDCVNLESVELPLYLETIRGSFNNCEKLRDIKFPSTLNYIAGFRGCNSIEVVDLSRCNFNSGYNTSASWSGAFGECASLKEIHLPQGVKSGNNTDYGYIEHNVKRPHTLKVYIPATWEELGSLNEWGNAELHFESPTAPGFFGHARNGDNVVIYCPKGSTTSYYNAVGGKIDNVKIIEQ